MRKPITYVAVWLAAGIGAIALGTTAVSLVGNQVTGSRPAPLSADEVRTELSGDTGDTTTTVVSASTTTPLEDATSTTVPTPPTTRSTTSGTGGAASTPTTTPTPTTQPALTAETRTYSLVGGTATLRFASSGVTVVVANPNAGYSVEVESSQDNGVRVEFRSDAHRSRVEGWWDGGPRDEVAEEDEADEADEAD